MTALPTRAMLAEAPAPPPWPDQEYELNETTMHRDPPFDLPPETMLDGRPEGADLLLQRALGRVRREKARESRRRQSFAVVVSTSLLAAALAGGVVIGRDLTGGDAGQVIVGAIANGTSMTATITPADGWLRLRADIDGVGTGVKCRLIVTDVRGNRFVAGGWVGADGEGGHGVTLSGAALVPTEDLQSVSVETVDGEVLVSAAV
jgi:hypothetical protein